MDARPNKEIDNFRHMTDDELAVAIGWQEPLVPLVFKPCYEKVELSHQRRNASDFGIVIAHARNEIARIHRLLLTENAQNDDAIASYTSSKASTATVTLIDPTAGRNKGYSGLQTMLMIDYRMLWDSRKHLHPENRDGKQFCASTEFPEEMIRQHARESYKAETRAKQFGVPEWLQLRCRVIGSSDVTTRRKEAEKEARRLVNKHVQNHARGRKVANVDSLAEKFVALLLTANNVEAGELHKVRTGRSSSIRRQVMARERNKMEKLRN